MFEELKVIKVISKRAQGGASFRFTHTSIDKLLKKLASFGLSQQSVAVLADVSEATLSRLLNGKSARLHGIKRVAAALEFEAGVMDTVATEVIEKGLDIASTSSPVDNFEKDLVAALRHKCEIVDKKLAQLDEVREPLVEERDYLSGLVSLYGSHNR